MTYNYWQDSVKWWQMSRDKALSMSDEEFKQQYTTNQTRQEYLEEVEEYLKIAESKLSEPRRT